MNHFPASILFSAAISAVLLSACSSDGNVGFGAGVNGLRVNPAPDSTPDPAPAPAATPVSGTSAAASVTPASLSVSGSGLTVTAPALSAGAATDGSVSVNGAALLSTGNLVQPVVGVLKSALGQSALPPGASANLNLNSGQTAQPGLLSNALAPVTGIASSAGGVEAPLSNGNVVGNVLNGTSAIANGAVSAATAIVGNTPLVGSLTSPAGQTPGNLLSIGTTPNNGAAVSLGNTQLLPLKTK